MDTSILPNRRFLLKALPATVAAAALPSLAIASTGKMGALIEAHKAALLARDAAWEREISATVAFYRAMDAVPVTVELPGLRLVPHGLSRPANAQELSRERIAQIYDHYPFYSGRGGARYVDGQFALIDLSADRARDEAGALANLQAANDRIAQVSADCGLTAAEAEAQAADEAVTATLSDVVACTPASEAEGRTKAAYLLGIMANGGSEFFDDDMTLKLIASFAGSDAPRLLAEAEHASAGQDQ